MFETKSISREEVVLSVVGSLSGEAANEFHRRVEELVGGAYATISLDLSQTEAINSSILGKILLFRKKLAEQQRTLQITGCSKSLYELFQMVNFDKLISIKK